MGHGVRDQRFEIRENIIDGLGAFRWGFGQFCEDFTGLNVRAHGAVGKAFVIRLRLTGDVNWR